MKSAHLEYGDSWMDVDVPDDAVIVRAGESFDEPPALDDPVEATRQALAEPLGSPPLRKLVGPGAKVTIAFPDRVKGGNHATSHRRVAIPVILEELAAAGVDERDVRLVCAIGLHRKNRLDEFESYLGREIVERFRGRRLTNHDPEDPTGIVQVGETEWGDIAEVNRAVVDADLSIMLGHTMGNPYGGYSGGYKMPCTGLTTWRSIRAHHTPGTMHRHDFVPASTHTRFPEQLVLIFIFGHSFGPGSQGKTMAALSYPTELRGIGMGWAESMSRVGTLLGFYVFPLVLAAVGLGSTLLLLALIPLAGLVSLFLIRWEPIGQDVETPTVATADPPTTR